MSLRDVGQIEVRFKVSFITLLFALFFCFKVQGADTGALSRVVSVEVMGRSLLYGPQFDQRVAARWSLGLGLSRMEVEASPERAERGSFLIPIFSQYYLADSSNSLYFSSGLTAVLQPKNVEGGRAILGRLIFPSAPFLVHLGVGYEIRQDAGFVFRMSGILTQGANLATSLGFGLGYLF